MDAHNSCSLHLPLDHNRIKIDPPLNVGVTPLVLLKPKTNNKLNTIELQTTVGEQGAWSMVKLNLAHSFLARTEHREEQEVGKLSSESGEWK